MPYKVIGSNVYHKKGGKWKIKQRAKSPAAAQRAVNLLRGVEHGWKPTGKKSSAKKRSKRGQKTKRSRK